MRICMHNRHSHPPASCPSRVRRLRRAPQRFAHGAGPPPTSLCGLRLGALRPSGGRGVSLARSQDAVAWIHALNLVRVLSSTLPQGGPERFSRSPRGHRGTRSALGLALDPRARSVLRYFGTLGRGGSWAVGRTLTEPRFRFAHVFCRMRSCRRDGSKLSHVFRASCSGTALRLLTLSRLFRGECGRLPCTRSSW